MIYFHSILLFSVFHRHHHMAANFPHCKQNEQELTEEVRELFARIQDRKDVEYLYMVLLELFLSFHISHQLPGTTSAGSRTHAFEGKPLQNSGGCGDGGANELDDYCRRHLYEKNQSPHELYRIFYYDCPPMNKKIYHPLLKQQVDFSKSELNIWRTQFLTELKQHRKSALAD